MILAGYLFLTFQTFQLTEKRTNLIRDIEELEKIKLRMTNDAKQKDTIINLQQKIIIQSKDESTVEKGIMLEKQFREPESGFFTKTDTANRNFNSALRYENQGYIFLLDKDVAGAVEAFRKSENSYNGFHQVYEIAVFLEKNKSALSDPNSDFWRTTYETILKEYSWKMPEDFKEQLGQLAR
jgi:hypothetical protein